MLNRRQALLFVPVLPLAVPLHSALPDKMTLCIHQTTSLAAGYRKSLEGYARAGIKKVEIIGPHVDVFVKSDGLPAARRLLSDLDLTAISHGGLQHLWEPGPERHQALDALRRHLEVCAFLGIDRLMGPCTANGRFTTDDYKLAVDNMREAGDIAKQFNVILMVEFTRQSNFIGTLPTSLRLTRQAAHSNIRPMLDCYHFWSGLSKFEDLELIHPGELHHVHFQDTPDIPRELLDSTTREIPGTGVAPLKRILHALASKGYSGPLSVELFYPKYQNGDPYAVARAIRDHAGALL